MDNSNGKLLVETYVFMFLVAADDVIMQNLGIGGNVASIGITVVDNTSLGIMFHYSGYTDRFILYCKSGKLGGRYCIYNPESCSNRLYIKCLD